MEKKKLRTASDDLTEHERRNTLLASKLRRLSDEMEEAASKPN